MPTLLYAGNNVFGGSVKVLGVIQHRRLDCALARLVCGLAQR